MKTLSDGQKIIECRYFKGFHYFKGKGDWWVRASDYEEVVRNHALEMGWILPDESGFYPCKHCDLQFMNPGVHQRHEKRCGDK